MAEEPKYPECEKMAAVHEKSQLCGEFLDWLREQSWEICEPDDDSDGWHRVHKSNEQLLADFFKIDLNKVEAERRAILANLKHDGETLLKNE